MGSALCFLSHRNGIDIRTPGRIWALIYANRCLFSRKVYHTSSSKSTFRVRFYIILFGNNAFNHIGDHLVKLSGIF